MEIEEIYAKTIEILGTGVNRRTKISIHNNIIEVITDESVTVKKLTQLDKVFGKEGYIRARDGGLYIRYKLQED